MVPINGSSVDALDNVSDWKLSLSVDGEAYILFDKNQEEVSSFELEPAFVVPDALDKMKADLEAGLSPYLIVSKDKASEIMHFGIRPESDFGSYVLSDTILGKQIKVLGSEGVVSFRLNRDFNIDDPKISGESYIFILKDPEKFSFHPKIFDEKNEKKYYRGIVLSQDVFSPEDFVWIKVKDLGKPSTNKYFEKPAANELEDKNGDEENFRKTVEIVRNDIYEETNEALDKELLSWTTLLEEDIYTMHDFNGIKQLYYDFFELAATPREDRTDPYGAYEPNDFADLLEKLEGKIQELKFFVEICKKMEKSYFSAEDKDNGVILAGYLKFIKSNALRRGYNTNTIQTMQKSLSRFFERIQR